MDIEIRKLTDLLHADYNPRKKLIPTDPEYKRIARSLDEFGYVDPIIINSDNTIIGGHQRATVLADKGVAEVQVVVLDIPKEKEKALNVALNKISGEWDMTMLRDVLSELSAGGYDITLTGFDIQEYEDILLQLQADAAEDDGFDAEEEYEKIEEPVARPGDIWNLGDHRVMCGDTCDPAAVASLMYGAKAQMIITDPPYNVDYEGAAGKIINDNISGAAFRAFLLDAIKNMYDHAEPGAAIYIFHADIEGITFRQSMIDAGFLFKQCLIWVKNHFVMGRQDYQWRHEPILYGWKDGAAHYFIDDRTQDTVIDNSQSPDFRNMKKADLLSFIEDYYTTHEQIPQSVIYCDKPLRSYDHPTMKPIPMLGRFIRNSSKPGWIVQDLFGGSGSTLIACEQLGRPSRLMEYDPKFVDVTTKRYIAFCKEKGKEPNIHFIRGGHICPFVDTMFA